MATMMTAAMMTAAIKERISVWTLGLTIVDVYRSVKACRDRGVSLKEKTVDFGGYGPLFAPA
jgi:hypothetical protein